MIDANRMLYKLRRLATGDRYQLDQAQEEAGELITAINHFKRKRPGSLEELIDETADALLMVEQIMTMTGEDVILNRVKEKVVNIRKMTKDKLFPEDEPDA